MKSRALLTGLVLAGVYLLSAALSGRLDVFARRPLLDGGSVPPPYRWVDPPPLFRETNIKPDAKRQVVNMPKGVMTEGEFVSTDDAQASVILPKGAVAPKPGATGATFTIDPRSPAGFAGYPAGHVIRGNVYEIRAAYAGAGGGPITTFETPARVVLSYPAHTAEFAGVPHQMIQSQDGKTWKVVPPDNDSSATLQIAISTTEIGFFAVIAKPLAVDEPGRSPAPFIIISSVVAVAGLAGAYAWRMARLRAENLKKRKRPRALPKNRRRR